MVHALSGAVALLAGPLHRGLRRKSLSLHRTAGRAYACGVWISSLTAAVFAPFFQVPAAARIGFGSLAVLWFATTTVGLQRAIAHRISEHREWMLRSFALSLFFVTGSLWMEVSRALPYAEEVTYPLAVFLGWVLNLAIAEAWIRAARGVSRSRLGDGGLVPADQPT